MFYLLESVSDEPFVMLKSISYNQNGLLCVCSVDFKLFDRTNVSFFFTLNNASAKCQLLLSHHYVCSKQTSVFAT